jgi:hypothetical protein
VDRRARRQQAQGDDQCEYGAACAGQLAHRGRLLVGRGFRAAFTDRGPQRRHAEQDQPRPEHHGDDEQRDIRPRQRQHTEDDPGQPGDDGSGPLVRRPA